MKKKSIISLIVACILTFALGIFSACSTPNEPTVEEINFKEGTIQSSYYLNEDIDYSSIKIVVSYSDDSTKEFALTDSTQGVSFIGFDTSTLGIKTLKAYFCGKDISINVEILSDILAPTVVEISFKADTVQKFYYLDDVINYSTIKIIATLSDETTREFALTDSNKGVSYFPIDTSTLGIKTLTAIYSDIEVEIEVEVRAPLVHLLEYSMPLSYQDYLTKSSNNSYKIQNNPYLVGSINKFSFVPTTTYIDEKLEDIITIDNPITTFKLFKKVDNNYVQISQVDNYLTVKDNMYDFTALANNISFKMEISLDENVYDLSSLNDDDKIISIEFKVVEAYNVYDTLGLSVIDNLNVKNWAEIKEKTTLKYDDKKLSEYTDVKLVVLHNDISINPDHLPANYFWKEDVTPNYNSAKAKVNAIDSALKTNFSSRLSGSLRDYSFVNSNNWLRHGYINSNANELSELVYDIDGDGIKENFNESWECVNHMKGLFNTNQTNISGNYMTISAKSESQTRHLTSVFGTDYDTVKTLMNGESVSFFPFSHWSIFKFYKTAANTDELNIKVENLTIQGNMSNDITTNVECGLTAINSVVDTLTVDNVITTQFYTHISTDNNLGAAGAPEAKLNVQLKNSIMFDAFSNMFTMWRSNVEVVNSELTNAAGPLFILSDGDREADDQESDGPSLTYDDTSILEAYATGQEAWYMANNATTLLKYIMGDFASFTSLITGYDNKQSPVYKSYLHNVNDVQQVNMIAVIIPEVGSIFNPESGSNISIKGTITIKGDSYNQTYNMVNKFIDENVDSQVGVVGFTSGSEHCALNIDTKKPTFSSEDPTSFAMYSTNTMLITLSAKMLGSAQNAPYFSCLIGGFDICQK